MKLVAHDRPGEVGNHTTPRAQTRGQIASRKDNRRLAGPCDPAGAGTATESSLADQLRVLGADRPKTLTSRANLAHWQVQTSRCSSVAQAELFPAEGSPISRALRALAPWRRRPSSGRRCQASFQTRHCFRRCLAGGFFRSR
jgi:hypothetical protein